MARIRTIKPEVAHSASLGRVSRDARLCFILLWTVADDSGRLRGDPRMLASVLFPYDDDAREGIVWWLDELDAQQHIVRYTVSGEAYIAIPKWSDHQRIDKPSKSRIPAPDDTLAEPYSQNPQRGLSEPSRATPERLALEGKGREGNGREGTAPLRVIAQSHGPRRGGSLIRSSAEQERLLRRNAYAGQRLVVPTDKHAEFVRRLGGASPDADLRAWYGTVDDAVTASGEAIDEPTVWAWLDARYRTWRANPVEGPSGADILAEMDRRAAEAIVGTTPEQARAILRASKLGQRVSGRG